MKVAHSDAHSIDASYLIHLQEFYEVGFLKLLHLELDITSTMALLEVQLKLFKGDKNNEKYLLNKNLIATLADIKDRFGDLIFRHEKLKYKYKDIAMENISLKEQNECLTKEIATLRKYNNL